MTETAIVVVVVALAAACVARTLWKRLTGRVSGCDCGQSCSGEDGRCPVAGRMLKDKQDR